MAHIRSRRNIFTTILKMSAKDYKILSSMNQTQQRVAGNSLVTEPGTLLTKIGNFVTKADADNLVM